MKWTLDYVAAPQGLYSFLLKDASAFLFRKPYFHQEWYPQAPDPHGESLGKGLGLRVENCEFRV